MSFQDLGDAGQLVRLGMGVLLGVVAGTGVGRPASPIIFRVLASGITLSSLTGFSPLYRPAQLKTTARHIGQPDHWNRYGTWSRRRGGMGQ